MVPSPATGSLSLIIVTRSIFWIFKTKSSGSLYPVDPCRCSLLERDPGQKASPVGARQRWNSTWLRPLSEFREFFSPERILVSDSVHGLAFGTLVGYAVLVFLLLFSHAPSFLLLDSCRFNCGLDLASLVVSSDLLHHSWDAISKLRPHPSRNVGSSPVSLEYTVSQPGNYRIIAFVASARHLQEGSDLVPSSDIPEFRFLRSKSNPVFSISRAAKTLFYSVCSELSSLKDRVALQLPFSMLGVDQFRWLLTRPVSTHFL